jgi:hypothetical protein
VLGCRNVGPFIRIDVYENGVGITFTWNGWIAVFSLPFGCATALMDELSSARTDLGRSNVLIAAVAAASTRRPRFMRAAFSA